MNLSYKYIKIKVADTTKYSILSFLYLLTKRFTIDPRDSDCLKENGKQNRESGRIFFQEVENEISALSAR